VRLEQIYEVTQLLFNTINMPVLRPVGNCFSHLYHYYTGLSSRSTCARIQGLPDSWAPLPSRLIQCALWSRAVFMIISRLVCWRQFLKSGENDCYSLVIVTVTSVTGLLNTTMEIWNVFLRKANYDNTENFWPLSLTFHYTVTARFNGWISNDYFIKYQKELPIKLKA